MAEIIDIVELRRRKVAKSYGISTSDLTERLKSLYDDYIVMMRKVVSGQSIKMDTLIVTMLEHTYFTLTTENGVEVAYPAISDVESMEQEDLLINGLAFLAPKKIILKNADSLDEHVVYALSEIFAERMFIENRA